MSFTDRKIKTRTFTYAQSAGAIIFVIKRHVDLQMTVVAYLWRQLVALTTGDFQHLVPRAF